MRRVKSPPAWLVKGAIVDYHAIIGESATEFNLRVRTDPQLMCDHWSVWLEGKAGSVSVDACTEATGSLGPSNDDSSAVQVEMRAAELEAWIAVDGLHVSDEFTPMEVDGWKMWVAHGDPVGVGPLAEEIRHNVEPGWQAAEMYTAGADERSDAWAWDISRPLSEQLAETAADDAKADALVVDESDEPDGTLSADVIGRMLAPLHGGDQ